MNFGFAGDSKGEGAESREYVFGAPTSPSEAWTIAAGGRLYDNWMEALYKDGPDSTHPAWPKSNTKQSGKVTWRCKSCHGWDYLGKDGVYRSGSYFTGISGVRSVVGRDPTEIVKLFSNNTHRFTDDMIPPDAKLRLAQFLSKGQDDIAKYVNADGTVNGDPVRGKAIFQNICAACHGYDGRTLNWGKENEPAYVGTEAKANPWEVLHKIRNGHPGHFMVSLRAFGLDDAANVLAYSQSLPVK